MKLHSPSEVTLSRLAAQGLSAEYVQQVIRDTVSEDLDGGIDITSVATATKSCADARTLLRANASIMTPINAPASTMRIGARSAYSSTGAVNVIYLPAISVGAGSVNPADSRT